MAQASKTTLARMSWRGTAASGATFLAYGLALTALAWAIDERWRHRDMMEDGLVLAVVLALCLGGLLEWVLVSSTAVLRGGAVVFEYCGRVYYVRGGLAWAEIDGVGYVRKWGPLGPRRYLRLSAGGRRLDIPAYALDAEARARLIALA